MPEELKSKDARAAPGGKTPGTAAASELDAILRQKAEMYAGRIRPLTQAGKEALDVANSVSEGGEPEDLQQNVRHDAEHAVRDAGKLLRTEGYLLEKGPMLYKKADVPGTEGKRVQKELYRRRYAVLFRRNRQGKRHPVIDAVLGRVHGASAAAKARTVRDFASLAAAGMPVVLILVVVLGVLIILLMSVMALGQGMSQEMVSSTSYLESDENILLTNKGYADMEQALKERLERTETDFPGYDEYRYDLDEIGHDPYALISYLSARYLYFTPEEAEQDLKKIMEAQYSLTYTRITETRYRDLLDENGDPVTDPQTGEVLKESYLWYVLKVELRNHPLEEVLPERLSEDEKPLYLAYQRTNGNRWDLFGAEGADNNYEYYFGEHAGAEVHAGAEIPDAGARQMMEIAGSQLGKPYQMGAAHGSDFYSDDPEKFDCSSFVCWVIDHSVGHIGINDTNGILAKCDRIPASEARPGDIIFFQKTYNYPGASHVGIVTGDGMMIHAGNPVKEVSYAESSYWQEHYLCIGRLKEEYRN